MLPLGISLTKRATADKGLVGFGHITDFFKGLFTKKKNEDSIEQTEDHFDTILSANSKDYEALTTYTDEKLMDIVQNHKQYEFDSSLRNSAIAILNQRGIGVEELRLKEKLSNKRYESALVLLNQFNKVSDIAFVSFIYLVIGNFILALFNVPSPIAFISYIVVFLIFSINIVKASIYYSNIYKELNKEEEFNPVFIFIIGALVYFIFYFYSKRKLRKEIKTIK